MREPALPTLHWPRFAWRTARSIASVADTSDEALFLRTCRDDDHAAFAELVSRYRVRVNGLVRRMLTADQSGIDPEDVAQDAFLDAYRRRRTFRAGSAFRPWLFGIAVNRCLDKIRSHQRTPDLALLPDDEEPVCAEAGTSPDPLDALMQSERWAEVDSAVALLAPKLRAVLVLRYIDDLSYEEIAGACGLPMGTVKTHLFRARAELKRRLCDED